jgi:hypothetical protein
MATANGAAAKEMHPPPSPPASPKSTHSRGLFTSGARRGARFSGPTALQPHGQVFAPWDAATSGPAATSGLGGPTCDGGGGPGNGGVGGGGVGGVGAALKKGRRRPRPVEESPLRRSTIELDDLYGRCCQEYRYAKSRNPRRVLSKDPTPVGNGGHDNKDADLIASVNDIFHSDTAVDTHPTYPGGGGGSGGGSGSAEGRGGGGGGGGGGRGGGDPARNRRYVVVDLLGQGTFGQVFKCQDAKDKSIVAIKVKRCGGGGGEREWRVRMDPPPYCCTTHLCGVRCTSVCVCLYVYVCG